MIVTHHLVSWPNTRPRQYDAYLRTVDQQRTRFGGSEAAPQEAARILGESINFSRQGQVAVRDRTRQ
jgi:hypothetical protein